MKETTADFLMEATPAIFLCYNLPNVSLRNQRGALTPPDNPFQDTDKSLLLSVTSWGDAIGYCPVGGLEFYLAFLFLPVLGSSPEILVFQNSVNVHGLTFFTLAILQTKSYLQTGSINTSTWCAGGGPQTPQAAILSLLKCYYASDWQNLRQQCTCGNAMLL